MTQKPYSVGIVILIWYAANLLGIAAGIPLIILSPLLKFLPGMLVSSLIIGLPLGLAQWLALRRVAPISPLWVITIPVGLLTGLLISPILSKVIGSEYDESVLTLTAAYVLIGLLVGLAQWVFLQRQFIKAWVWPLSSAFGLGLGMGLVLATDLINRSGILSFFLASLVYAVATGTVIAWLPAWRKKNPPELVHAT